MSAVYCPRCFKEGRWHATGRFNENRHGRRRAELVCDGCHYAFSSGRPEAVTEGDRVRGDVPSVDAPAEVRSVIPQVSLPGTRPRQNDFSAVGSLAADWKVRQAGDE